MTRSLDADFRRLLPHASHWRIKLLVAMARGDDVEIACPNADVELAIRQKLWPHWYPDARPSQATKKVASIALDQGLRPRRTAQRRGRPPLHLDRVVAAILACFEGQHYYDEARLHSIVLAHLGRLSVGERVAVLRDVEQVAGRQGRRADWRRWLGHWRRLLKQAHHS